MQQQTTALRSTEHRPSSGCLEKYRGAWDLMSARGVVSRQFEDATMDRKAHQASYVPLIINMFLKYGLIVMLYRFPVKTFSCSTHFIVLQFGSCHFAFSTGKNYAKRNFIPYEA